MLHRNISFSYSSLELMAAGDAQGNPLFFGARKVSTFKEKANLVSKQLAKVPDSQLFTTPVPALNALVNEFAGYFGVESRHVPEKINMLWYAGFLAKHICALDDISGVLDYTRNYGQFVSQIRDLEKLGAKSGYMAYSSNLSDYFDGSARGFLARLNFYTVVTNNNSNHEISLNSVLTNIKYLGIALLTELYTNLDAVLTLPRKTKKNLENNNLYQFIRHDMEHGFSLLIYQQPNTYDQKILAEFYKLMSKYLINHLIHYPDMQTFKFASAALFLIMHEGFFEGAHNEFKRSQQLFSKLSHNVGKGPGDTHHNRLALEVLPRLDNFSVSELKDICELNYIYQCIDICDAFNGSGIEIKRPDFAKMSTPEEERAAAKEFIIKLSNALDYAFECFNEVAEHALACKLADGESYDTKFARAIACNRPKI